MTELQKHVSFFDRNKDGIITPLETFQALLPRRSMPGALPPYVNIYVKYIHKAIHGSDTGAYDSKGRYGFLTKERARGIYDGTIFVELEERWKSQGSDALSDLSAAAF
nr:unnamed protein product [Digitaria exilis]